MSNQGINSYMVGHHNGTSRLLANIRAMHWVITDAGF